MSKVIRVSAEVFERLQKHAEPFVDSPSDVVEHLLDYYESETGNYTSASEPECESSENPAGRQLQSDLIERSRTGALSEETLRKTLLIALLRHDGSAETATALGTVRQILEDLDALNDVDLEISSESNKWERWETNTRFARKHLVDEGFLKDDSKRGWWELSNKGYEKANQLASQVDV